MQESASIAPPVPLPHTLRGQAVLIIGGSSGIGLAAAQQLIDIGAQVTLVARDAERLAGAAARLGGQVQTAQADVGDAATLAALFARPARYDHVFVTAGALAGGPIASTDPAAVQPMVDSRIWGAYHVARLAAPRLTAGGSLTFTTSGAVYRPLAGLAVGAAAVAGVEAMMRALALELAPLRVNAVRPSATDTPMLRGFMGGADDAAVAAAYAHLPLGRPARPEEVAAAALFCMANAYVTGSVVVVDGGASLV